MPSCVSTLSLLLLMLAAVAPTLPAPMRMRSRQISVPRLLRRTTVDGPTPSLSCVIQHLQEALDHVDITYDFEVSKYPAVECM